MQNLQTILIFHAFDRVDLYTETYVPPPFPIGNISFSILLFYVYEEYLYLVWRQSSVWVHFYLSFIISG